MRPSVSPWWAVGGILAAVAAVISLPAAYITHVIWAVKVLMADTQTTGQIVLSLLGLVPPVGIIHGFILWL